jgi:hypothetical protein
VSLFSTTSGRPVGPCTTVQGLWDIYLPEDVVREFNKLKQTEFQIEAVDRYFRVRFVDKG